VNAFRFPAGRCRLCNRVVSAAIKKSIVHADHRTPPSIRTLIYTAHTAVRCCGMAIAPILLCGRRSKIRATIVEAVTIAVVNEA
jgi:hypothetical protein